MLSTRKEITQKTNPSLQELEGLGGSQPPVVHITKPTGGRIPRILSHFLGDVEVHPTL